MGWELLTGLLDSSKGRKPTLILRTQLSLRVNAILGECVRISASSASPPPCPGCLRFFQACAGQQTEQMGDGMCDSSHSYPDLFFQGSCQTAGRACPESGSGGGGGGFKSILEDSLMGGCGCVPVEGGGGLVVCPLEVSMPTYLLQKSCMAPVALSSAAPSSH